MTDPLQDGGQSKPIKKLIITNPYDEPTEHWKFNPRLDKYEKKPGRRPAGYTKATQGSKKGHDAALFEEIPYINQIREKVSEWRLHDYVGSTRITKQLLKRWRDVDLREPDNRFFYCQLEAIETIIWAHEVGKNDALIRNLDGDGGSFRRFCCKMATGTGKTVVMAMLIAWQVLNHIRDRDGDFTRNILVVTPSISVKRRLTVLRPNDPNNYYEKFAIVDRSGLEKLNRARIKIHNWHVLMNAAVQKKPAGQAVRVMRDIPISDSKFSKDVLGHISRNILVINDEAHHAWRPTKDNEGKMRKNMKEEKERATRWMEGLDKIKNDRNILACYDFSATPFRPTGHSVSEVERFQWIISDFSLEDAIESGLVKTPRTPKDDDSSKHTEDGRSRFHHIFPLVKGDFKMNQDEQDPLPPLVSHAYDILAASWNETLEDWKDSGYNIPPVMITVCNNTKSASRIMNHFKFNKGQFKNLVEGMEKIDSVAVDDEESNDSAALRTKIDTVGRTGEPGQDVTHVVSVNMLTEGWDAHNVTHIMGLRAFESQLLCEQVVGRGLRRKSYDVDPNTGLLLPEYVNVFGIPFSFMPHEESDDTGDQPTQPVTAVCPVKSKNAYEIGWPRGSVKIELRHKFITDWRMIPPTEVDGRDVITSVNVAPSLSGKHIGKEKNLRVEGTRLQEFIFRMSSHVYPTVKWRSADPYKLADLIRTVARYINNDMVTTVGVSKTEKERYVRALKANMNDIVKHVRDNMIFKETENEYFKPDDPIHPVISTGTMPTWHSRRKWLQDDEVSKCHLNAGVYDNGLEKEAMHELESNNKILAWVKNDQHLGFKVSYHFEGAWHEYYPDFLVRFENGITAVIEMKGAEEKSARRKQAALDDWIRVVNKDGGYGTWRNCGLIRDRSELKDAIEDVPSYHKSSVDMKQSTTCPACGNHASGGNEINLLFGFRNTNGIIRPQSWCRRCRTVSQT